MLSKVIEYEFTKEVMPGENSWKIENRQERTQIYCYSWKMKVWYPNVYCYSRSKSVFERLEASKLRAQIWLSNHVYLSKKEEGIVCLTCISLREHQGGVNGGSRGAE